MTHSPAELVAVADTIRETLADAEIDFAEPTPGRFFANLPGQRRLKTGCWLIVGASSLSIEAFVVRKPDENSEQVYHWLLSHNSRMFGVAWSIDEVGDIYLTGRWPLSAVTPEAIDTLLGSVLDNADDSFNTLLELGFGSSIRREWAWRERRGESMANLAAFEGFVKRNPASS
ncbi:YbjN domain-containing protein [Jatrophihabitans sp. DSM 45814]